MKPKKTRKPRGNTRLKILHAALDSFARVGIGETTVSRIAEQAGIPHTLVLYHFPNMESLYLEAILSILDDLKEITVRNMEEAAPDSARVLDAYVAAPFQWAEKNPKQLSLWIYFYSLAASSPQFRNLNDTIRKQGRDRISAMLYQAATAKALPARVAENVTELSVLIQGLITGMVLLASTESSANYPALLKSTQRAVLTLLKNA